MFYSFFQQCFAVQTVFLKAKYNALGNLINKISKSDHCLRRLTLSHFCQSSTNPRKIRHSFSFYLIYEYHNKICK
jgi:hypothetical protein